MNDLLARIRLVSRVATTCGLLFISTVGLKAANWYVTPSGAGTHSGVNWSEAWHGTGGINWSLVNGGDTIWAAGGTYSSFSWTKSGLAGQNIALRRATGSNVQCTSAAGWQPSLDAQVRLIAGYGNGYAGIYMVGVDYVTIDGQVPNGIKCVLPMPTDDWNTTTTAQVSGIKGAGSGCEIKFVEIQGPNVPAAYYGVLWGDDNQVGWKTGLLISHCYVHHSSNGFQVGATDSVTIEYCEIAYIYGNTYNHDNGLYIYSGINGVYRYNYMHDFGSYGMAFPSLYPPGPNHWKIYGNVWQNTANPSSGQAMVFDNSYVTGVAPYQFGSDWQIYNNTVANVALGMRTDSRFPDTRVRCLVVLLQTTSSTIQASLQD